MNGEDCNKMESTCPSKNEHSILGTSKTGNSQIFLFFTRSLKVFKYFMTNSNTLKISNLILGGQTSCYL